MQRLRGKRVLITGASSGIGAACAAAFAQAGSELLVCSRERSRLDPVVAQLSALTKVYPFALDVRHRLSVESSLAALPQEWRQIDILVNNAGLALGLEPLHQGSIEEWEQMIDTNLKGLLYVTRAVLPQMIERGSGHVINLGSTAGHRVYPGGNVYCATKHAVDALSRALKRDLEGTRIRVSSVDPGAVQTNFSTVRFRGDAERAARVYENMQPLTPEDVAEVVVFCASRPEHVNLSGVVMIATDQPSIL